MMTKQPILLLNQAITTHALDGVLITDPKHVYYLTGFASNPHERFLGLVLVQGEEPTLIVPSLDEEAATAASTVKNIVTHQDTDNPYVILKKYLPRTMNNFGIEKDHLSLSRYEELVHYAEAKNFVDIGPLLRELRVRKAPHEVERMKVAANLIEEVLRRGLTHVKEGVTEVELVAEMEYQMKKLGASGPSFDTMVLSGPNTALPHGVPGSRKLAYGDLLMFDMGVYVNGYASDITRTFAFGELSPELTKVYNTVLEANLKGIESVKPGVTLGSVDLAARQVTIDAGYGERFLHRLGHGLGIDVHEYPSVHGANQELLTEGMAFTIEPGIYVPGLGGVRIEDEVIVTAGGVELLTSFPKELQILG